MKELCGHKKQPDRAERSRALMEAGVGSSPGFAVEPASGR